MVAQLGPLVATFCFYTSLCWGSHKLSIKDAAKNMLYLGLLILPLNQAALRKAVFLGNHSL